MCALVIERFPLFFRCLVPGLVCLFFCGACRDNKATETNNAARAKQTSSQLALVGGTLIDGTGHQPTENSVVLIEGNKIIRVGLAHETTIPKGARIIDLKGKWVMPGMIDSHTHFIISSGLYSAPYIIDMSALKPYEKEIEDVENRIAFTLSRYLCSGITTAIDLGGSNWTYGLRKNSAELNNSPRVAVSGPFLAFTTEASKPQLWKEDDPAVVVIQNPEQARAYVAELDKQQVDVIKTGYLPAPEITLEDYIPILEALVEESHARDLPVVCHAMELDTAKAAIRAGIDVLAHVPEQPVDDAFIQLVLERKVIVISTVDVYMGYQRVLSGKPTLYPFEQQCGDPEIIASWKDIASVSPEKRSEITAFAAAVPELAKVMRQNLLKLYQAGATLSLGTDAGNMGTLHGPAILREILALKELGVAPMDILLAATRNSAQVLNREPDRGTIEPGKLADLLILNDDPLTDIHHITTIHQVVIDGRLLDHASLLGNE